MSCGEPSSNPTWLGREAARVGHDQPWCECGRARTCNRQPLAIQRLAGRSQACVNLWHAESGCTCIVCTWLARRPWFRWCVST